MDNPVPDHDQLKESTGLYVLGILDDTERASFEAHLGSCDTCRGELASLGRAVRALPYAVPQVAPSPGLRASVLAAAGRAITPGREPTVAASRQQVGYALGWLSAAALLVLTVGLGAYVVAVRGRAQALEGQLREVLVRLDRSERQLAVATGALAGAEMRVAVLTAPDLQQVDLAGQPPAPGASGRAFWSPSRGLVFAAADLPQLPAGRVYQLWYLTAGAPVSAGLLRPDNAGRVASAFDPAPNLPLPTGLALSIEPEGGVPAPTGPLYLAGFRQPGARRGTA